MIKKAVSKCFHDGFVIIINNCVIIIYLFIVIIKRFLYTVVQNYNQVLNSRIVIIVICR